ncbi:hypothetical protein BsWGS_07357 [Bradybaena similaris]
MAKKKNVKILTDDEKAAFEEQRRLLEEEMRKKKEEVLSQFLKDKLMHEERATLYNKNKLNYQWRKIMQSEKGKELKKDIELLSQTFERVIDTKDAVIRAMANEMMEADEMYAMAVRSHLQVMDYLLDVQKERLDMTTREYCEQLEMICEEFDLERDILIESYQNQMRCMDDILYAIEVARDKDEKDDRAEYEAMEVDIKNKTVEDKQALRFVLGSKIEELWQQFRQMLQTYSEDSELQMSTYEVLKNKDDKRSREVDINVRKIRRLETNIAQQRTRLAAQSWGKYGIRVGVMIDADDDEEFNKAERLQLARDFQRTKSSMDQVRLRTRAHLVKMSTESRASLQQLRKQKEKGVSVLKMAEICRKLETEEEKLIPFYASSLSQQEEENVTAFIMEPSSLLMMEAWRNSSGLQNFWKRYNKVFLDKLSLEKEKETLSAANQHLRTLLKHYLDSISVNDEVMRQNNALLMVKSSVTTKTLADIGLCYMRKTPHTTVIEAAHVAKQLHK